jgi:hypothetical protein
MTAMLVGLVLLGSGCAVGPGENSTQSTSKRDNSSLDNSSVVSPAEGASETCQVLAEGENQLTLEYNDPQSSWKGEACLVLPDAAISVSVYGFSNSDFVQIADFYPVEQPDETKALQEFIWWDFKVGEFSSLGTHVHPEFTWRPGDWRVSTINVDTLKVMLKTELPPSRPSLRVFPFLGSTQWSASSLMPTLREAQTIFQEGGVEVTLEPVTELGADYASVGDFGTGLTNEMLAKGSAAGVNLFLVDDLQGINVSGYLGKAAGIPGSAGVVSGFNGVLINLSAHETAGSLDNALLAETLAHESGHFLGLFHTTESSGTLFDPLSDTPECPLTEDQDGNSRMSAEECQNFDGNNLMFWTAYGTLSRSAGLRQHTITPLQVEVLARSPLAH